MGKSIVQTVTNNKSTGFGRSRNGYARAMCIACGVLFLLMFSGCTGERPTDIGVHDGKLKNCPSSPNCVSTNATEDAEHSVTPLLFSADSMEVMKRVRLAVKSQDRARIITENENYLYAEFESLVFRFVDDVEFYFDSQTGTLHVRSASRIGESDLGVNRERVELIYSLLKKTDKKPKA